MSLGTVETFGSRDHLLHLRIYDYDGYNTHVNACEENDDMPMVTVISMRHYTIDCAGETLTCMRCMWLLWMAVNQ